MGEGLNNERELMPYISSCNIACGGHTGSAEIIDRVMALALKHNVRIGAHPSFPDRKNFGRKLMDLSERQLRESLKDQLELFRERATMQNGTVNHVKAHGALYHLVASDEAAATLFVQVVKDIFKDAAVYAPWGSETEKAARRLGVTFVCEAFADRNYNDDLSLVSRDHPIATITDPDQAVAHVKRIVERSRVKTLSGKELELKAQTLCIHGDNKNAVHILKALHQVFS